MEEDPRTPPKPPPQTFDEAKWRTMPPSWARDRGKEGWSPEARKPGDQLQGRTPVKGQS